MQAVLDRVKLRGITPIVPVRSVHRSVGFYTQVLDFALAERNREGTYAYVTRGETGLMLLDLADGKAVKATAEYLSAYVWVDGIVALHEALRPRLASLGAARYRPLFEKPDGRQEFHVRDPDGLLLFFGAALEGASGR
ncbi:MAG: VOC family protein [Paracoccaceae bacterium]